MNNYLYTRQYGLKEYITWFYFKLVLLFVMLIYQVHTCAYQEANCID
jgi:hypothetical protein